MRPGLRAPLRSVLRAPLGLAGLGLQAETMAVWRAMTVKPTVARLALMDDLVVALKAAGVWSKLGNLYVMAAHDAQAARINWVLPGTGDLSTVNSPTFTADRGYQGDGATSYLTAGIAPRSPYALNDAHVAVWSRTDSNLASSHELGSLSNATLRMSLRNSSDQFGQRLNSGGALALTNTDSRGHFVMTRVDAVNIAGYRNGVSLGSSAIASSAVPVSALVLLRSDLVFSARQLAIAHAGSGFSAADADAAYDAFNAWITAVGAA